jgi:hypothetical protein
MAQSTGPDMRAAAVGEVAHASTLFIQCYGTGARPAPATASTTPGGKPADDPSFRLVNRGQVPVAELFATPAGTGSWGRNRLDQGKLAPQEARLFRLPPRFPKQPAEQRTYRRHHPEARRQDR